MAVSKKLRFEVFKRDSFTCQYCGQSAPDAVLECDHIEPVSKGGEDDILNLVTSCFDCNRGKSDRKLDDDTVLAKRKGQLDELQERREQIEMMLDWQHGLLDAQEELTRAVIDVWERIVDGFHVTDTGHHKVEKWVKKFAFSILCEAMQSAADKHLKRDDSGELTKESVNQTFRAVPRFAGVLTSERSGEAPHLRECLYIRGIVRNRMDYCEEQEAINLLVSATRKGVDVAALKQWALEARWYTEWRDGMKRMVD